MNNSDKPVKLNSDNRYNGCPVPIVAITGGIGTGKSTFCDLLEQQGFIVLRADLIVKKTYDLESVKSKLKELAPTALSQKKIDFQKLRTLFFSNEKLKTQIENLIYSNMPLVFNNEIQKNKNPQVIFYEIPLLFEKNLKEKFDFIICISIDQEEQIKRIQARDYENSKDPEVHKILKSQLSLKTKEQGSDLVIVNTTQEDLKKGLEKFITQYLPKIIE
jgi:dephospho-CoA kinase